MKIFLVTALCFSLASASPSGTVRARSETRVRKPAAAGQFYPSDPAQLAAAVHCYLADAIAPFKDRPLAIVVPHAGYVFSGQIAADAYKQTEGNAYDVVVILGVNHTVPGFRGVSLYSEGEFETPLGRVRVDGALARKLMAADKRFVFDERVHEREHSIEVQLPFIQTLFPEAAILPAVIASTDPDLCSSFGEALAKILHGKRALIVASSDLSHYPACADAERVDRETLGAMKSLDAKAFQAALEQEMSQGVGELATCACGEAAVFTAMVAARRLGATGAQIISYANSGHGSVGDRSRVVGYGAAAFVSAQSQDNVGAFHPEESALGECRLTPEQRTALLAFARKTIRQYLESSTTPLPRNLPAGTETRSGAFVTLRRNGELRGCIGRMEDDLPLNQAVGYCALQAAFNDRRFEPVRRGELSDLNVEISVLTPYKMVKGCEDIQIGRDGVLMKKDGRSAVFLPSVAVEQGWTRDDMLSHLSIKAGLSLDAWKKNATFYTFQAIVFGEPKERAKPVRE